MTAAISLYPKKKGGGRKRICLGGNVGLVSIEQSMGPPWSETIMAREPRKCQIIISDKEQ